MYCIIINDLHYRKAQRIIHIIFNKPDEVPKNQVALDDRMSQLRMDISSALPYIIKMAQILTSDEARKYVAECIMPLVSHHLHNVHHRVAKCYTLVFVAAKLVSKYWKLYMIIILIYLVLSVVSKEHNIFYKYCEVFR